MTGPREDYEEYHQDRDDMTSDESRMPCPADCGGNSFCVVCLGEGFLPLA